MVGTAVQRDIFMINCFINFIIYQVEFAGDLAKTYHQVELDKEDSDFINFLETSKLDRSQAIPNDLNFLWNDTTSPSA